MKVDVTKSLRARRFEEVYNSITAFIEYDPEWSNGKGYFDHSVVGPHAVVLKPGQFAKSATAKGRRIIFQGTHLGVIAIFDRFQSKDGVFVVNAPPVIERAGWYNILSLSDEDMIKLLGQPEDATTNNAIWNVIAQFKEEFNRLSKLYPPKPFRQLCQA